MFNKLLLRQIQKQFGELGEVPETLVPFLKVVSDSYDHYEKDRKMLERSIELSSNEMIELNSSLRRETNELKKAHHELDTLFRNIEEVFFSIDMTKLRIIQISAACEKVFGYGPGLFTGNIDLLRRLIHPDDQAALKDHMRKILEGRCMTNQYRIVHRDQNIRWVEMKIMPTVDNGRLVRIDGVANDITEKKKSESEMLDLVNHLQVRNRELRQFAYILSHNIRAPIAKIMGLLSLFTGDPEGGMTSDVLIDYLNKETSNLDNIVRDMNIILTARDSGKAEKEPVHLASELVPVKQVLKKEIAESGALITAEFLDPTVIVTVKDSLYSILYNLLSNSIKYRQRGVSPRIHLQTGQDKEHVYLSVQDNGMGIDLDRYGTKIFGLYKRFHSGDIPGRGTGLLLVKTQVESLGGRVEVESELNKGTTFKVFFPKEAVNDTKKDPSCTVDR